MERWLDKFQKKYSIYFNNNLYKKKIEIIIKIYINMTDMTEMPQIKHIQPYFNCGTKLVLTKLCIRLKNLRL